MKYLIFGISILLGISCKLEKQTSPIDTDAHIIPQRFILKTDSAISTKNDIVYWKDSAYSGFLLLLSTEKKDTLLLEGYLLGKLHGDCKKWYSNKQLMEERHYLNGNKHGEQIAYWPNGKKRFEFTAVNDAYEGEMKEWNEEGHLFHLANYVKGQEEGAQKLWYENGKIRANYVMLNGKRFGLLGTKNCKNVSDSIFVVK